MNARWTCTSAACAKPWPILHGKIWCKPCAVSVIAFRSPPEMWHGWRRELDWLALYLSAVLTAGWLLNQVWAALAVFVLGYLLRHLFSLHGLLKQLSSGSGDYPPSGSGVWDEIYYQFHQLRRRSKRRKKRLVRMVERFRNAFAVLPDAIVILGEDDEIQWYNAAAENLLGLKKSDIGLLIANLVRSPKFVEFLQTGDGGAHTVNIRSPNDPQLMLEIRLVPYDKDMRLVMAQDVSQLRFMERVRSDFVANVSHELRTPLTVLKGYLETLADADDPALQRYGKALTSMEEQAGRMQRLIDDLLSLTRLESTTQNHQRLKQVDVAFLLREIYDDVARMGTEHAAVALHLSSNAALWGDEQELRSAFSNLLVNAIKYTPATGQVDLVWRDEEGGAVRLDVRDTGEGIAEQHIPRLTERFYRVDSAVRGKVGVGLGLAIVKHVLLRHDAELKIASQVGQGSCFSCCFPAKRVVRD
ncbi:MAG: phosphate regulon sensor histidine kinase PhoR [Methylococcaceae bacterium]|nr:MAG: phosphate regulon sensor histidine kinase PhoR [Methylococcaceae bacterium]